jgi:hypothetical protein
MLSSRSNSAAARVDDRLFVVCGLAWAAGLIHVLAAIQHVDEYLLFAVFFALLAPVQFAWGVAVYRRPGQRLLLAGAVGSLAVALLWLVSRTIGLPLGETPWQPEPVGAIDVLATADEVVLALMVFAELAPRRALVPAYRVAAAAAGTGLILLSSLALVAGGHAH